ncbi:MAG: oxidoreductase, partial [Methanoculleus horonobensis]|nr:oxidoreductase [Methanoculleus horonobensis]
MNSNPSPSNSSRFEGCTLTGALSVLTEVRDAVSVIHGPAGCTHHNFSL